MVVLVAALCDTVTSGSSVTVGRGRRMGVTLCATIRLSTTGVKLCRRRCHHHHHHTAATHHNVNYTTTRTIDVIAAPGGGTSMLRCDDGGRSEDLCVAAAATPPPGGCSGHWDSGSSPARGQPGCWSLPRCQPAAPVPDLHPTDTHCTGSSSPPSSNTLPSVLLQSSAPLPRSLYQGSDLGGDASPSRAPRCACTLAVTCEAGEQRFRCVRGVPAQLSGYTKQAAHRLLVLYPATTTNPSLLLYKEQPAAFHSQTLVPAAMA